jgi:hypothetical protein
MSKCGTALNYQLTILLEEYKQWILFICTGSLFNDTFSVIQHLTSNERMMGKWLFGKNMEYGGGFLSLGLKHGRGDTDHSPPTSTKVKNE